MAAEYGEGGGFTVTMDGPFGGAGASAAKVIAIQAPAENWKGGESPYSQPVTVDGVTVNSKVDVQLSVEQMTAFGDRVMAFQAVNSSGIVTLYAYGNKPTEDCVVQATITETMSEGLILGDIFSTTTKQADYAQEDPEKSDYIKNKPTAEIAKAQSTADGAKKTAEAALPKSGGEMTGSLDMGANPITNLADPNQDSDGVNKGYLVRYADSRILHATAQLTAAGWSAGPPYTQTVALSGILSTDRPHISPVYSTTLATAIAQKESWAMVCKAVTANGSITFTCFEDKPSVNIPIQLEVNR